MTNNARVEHKSEDTAKAYLEMRGYRVIEQNYRRSRYHIDLIAEKAAIIFFVSIISQSAFKINNQLPVLTQSTSKYKELAAESWREAHNTFCAFRLSVIVIAEPEHVVLSFYDNE